MESIRITTTTGAHIAPPWYMTIIRITHPLPAVRLDLRGRTIFVAVFGMVHEVLAVHGLANGFSSQLPMSAGGLVVEAEKGRDVLEDASADGCERHLIDSYCAYVVVAQDALKHSGRVNRTV